MESQATLELYSIKDDLIGFSQPFFSQSEQVALRQFIASVRATTPNIANTFPENKKLYRVGIMNLLSGEIEKDVTYIASAMTYVEVAKDGE